MPDALPVVTQKPDPSEVAERLGAALNRLGIEYAFGGAIALGYWAQPRGTLDVARQRRARVLMGDEFIHVWSAETLAVFKMMFFRGTDHIDVERLLRDGGNDFDRTWVRDRLVEIFGARDPRIPAWDELVTAVGE